MATERVTKRFLSEGGGIEAVSPKAWVPKAIVE
jgi:hypothetical protein